MPCAMLMIYMHLIYVLQQICNTGAPKTLAKMRTKLLSINTQMRSIYLENQPTTQDVS